MSRDVGPGPKPARHIDAALEAIDGADEALERAAQLRDLIASTPGLQDDIVNGKSKVAWVPTGQETRVVSETGGEKGTKLARFDLIPTDVLWELAEHYGRGARKYDDRNWQRGYDWSLSYAALQRHLALFWQGVDVDDDPSLLDEAGEARSRHIIAALWHCVALAWFSTHGVGTDNRDK